MRIRPLALRRRAALAALLPLLLFAAPAHALPAFDLLVGPGDMQNNWNVPKITLTNTSTAGEAIVGFSITVGDVRFVFDFVASLGSNPAGRAANVATEALTGAVLVAGDRVNGSGSVQTLVWSFAHFAPGEALVFEVDVDHGNGSQTVDVRSIWFDNGGQPNAAVEVAFAGGAVAAFTMPDVGSLPPSLHFGFAAVPEPGTAVLLAAGLALLARPRSRV